MIKWMYFWFVWAHLWVRILIWQKNKNKKYAVNQIQPLVLPESAQESVFQNISSLVMMWMRVCLLPCNPCVIYYTNTINLISVHHNLRLSSASLVGFVHLWPAQWPEPSTPERILALTPVSGPDSDPSRVRRWSLKP